ncbi:MAG TPA: LytTR family DNA-binding domain-containing protein [Puia sp.]|uniref:LytR/AlgR family response regulator transcription factor n=1 Tax=Puia sp. TaxID=2045100 RepID=UPI002C4E888B|nr:LytTR family DNA-binding domain-containing protein [Puia sp.]HVU94031.1 LytTR family DNA-binding domain-containing protein [Puia sp.]
MSKIRCIIVEDEPLAVKVLADYIAQTPFLELQGSFKDAILAAEYLRRETVDLLFLDIHLPKLKGMDFLRTLARPPAVIITTAYHQYAVEGFELNVTDYLLKPVEYDRFLAAVNKVPAVGIVGVERDYIFVPVQKKRVKIFFDDIVYIESQREYVRIRTAGGEWLTKMGTQEIEALLPGHLFRRVHRSYIVAIRRISSYTAEMIEIGGESIPIGKGYRGTIRF